MTFNSMFLFCGFLLLGANYTFAQAGQGKLLYTFKNGFELRYNEITHELTHSVGRPGEQWHKPNLIPTPEGYELKQVLSGMTNNLSEALPDLAQWTIDPLNGSVAFYFVSLKNKQSQQTATKWLLVADSSGSWNWMKLEHPLSPKNHDEPTLSQKLFNIGASVIQGEIEPKLSNNEFSYHGYGLRAFEADETLFVISAFGIYPIPAEIKKKPWYIFGSFAFQDMKDKGTFVLKRNEWLLPIDSRELIFESAQNMLHTGKLVQNLNPSELLNDQKTRDLLLQELDRFTYLEFTDLDLAVDFIEARFNHITDQDEASRLKASLVRAMGANVQLAVPNLSVSPSESSGRMKFQIIESQLCEILSARQTRYLHSSHRFGLR